MVLDQTGTEWLAIVYEVRVEPRQALALVKGDVTTDEPVLCRVHSGSVVGDIFTSSRADGGTNLRKAIDAIEREGRGVLLYLDSPRSLAEEFTALMGEARAAKDGEVPPPADSVTEAPHTSERARSTLRKFGLGAQMLSDLGAKKLRLLTNSKRKIAGLHGYGLEVVGRMPLQDTKEE
jgi:3,4-dihydroxy 2-butanone 4-phosphate synthase/GTP cyclohydrolase II